MNRRSLLASALLAGAGAAGLGKLAAALPPAPSLVAGLDADQILARWESAIVQAHGREAFEKYRPYVEQSAADWVDLMRHGLIDEKSVAGIGQTWVDLIGRWGTS